MNKLEIEFFRVKKLRVMLLRAFLRADADLLKLSLRREKEIEVMAEKMWREQNAAKKRENKLKTIEMNKRKWRLSKGEKKQNAKSLSEVKKRTAKLSYQKAKIKSFEAEKLRELKVKGFEGKRYYH